MMVFTEQLAKRLSRLLIRGEHGASLVEYGLLLVVIVFAVGVAAGTLSGQLQGFLTNIGSVLTSGNVPDPTP